MNEKTLKELFESENITVSDAFLNGLVGLFESAIKEKKEELEKDNKEKIDEKIKTLDENVDAFISSKTKSWINENALIVEDATKVKLAESLFKGLKQLAEDNNIEIDDSQTLIVESKDAEIKTLKDEANSRIEKELQLESKIKDLKSKNIITEETKDLAMTQIELITEKSKDLVYESNEDYTEKVKLIVESVVSGSVKPKKEPKLINESVDAEVQAVLDSMKG